jgi:Flp pilus assembly protein TadD
MRFFHLVCAIVLIAVGVYAAEPAPKSQVAIFQQKVKDDPKNAVYWNDLGAAYGKHGEWKNAVNALNKAVTLKKDYAHAWYNLGFAYENAKVFGKAVESYKKAIEFKSEFPEAWLSLGVTYQKQGRLEEARKVVPILQEQNSKMAAALAKLIESTPPPPEPKKKRSQS